MKATGTAEAGTGEGGIVLCSRYLGSSSWLPSRWMPNEPHRTHFRCSPTFPSTERATLQRKEEFERQADEPIRKCKVQLYTNACVGNLAMAKEEDGRLRMRLRFSPLSIIVVGRKFPMPQVDQLCDLLPDPGIYSSFDFACAL